MNGKAYRGSEVSFGEFGLKAMEPGWITSRQIEAARIAITVRRRRDASSGSGFSRTSRSPASLLKPEWVRERAILSSGLLS